MSDDDVVWADELPPETRSREWTTKAYELAMTRPGVWARVRFYDNGESARRVATALRRGTHSYASMPPGQWDVATRRDGKGAWLWLKYEPKIDDETVTASIQQARPRALRERENGIGFGAESRRVSGRKNNVQRVGRSA